MDPALLIHGPGGDIRRGARCHRPRCQTCAIPRTATWEYDTYPSGRLPGRFMRFTACRDATSDKPTGLVWNLCESASRVLVIQRFQCARTAILMRYGYALSTCYYYNVLLQQLAVPSIIRSTRRWFDQARQTCTLPQPSLLHHAAVPALAPAACSESHAASASSADSRHFYLFCRLSPR